MCQEFCPQDGGHVWDTHPLGMRVPPRHTYTPLGMHTPPGMHAPWHAYPPSGCHEIRSMSRQYASYWNAFLLLVKSCTQCAEGILNQHVLYLFPGVHEKLSLFINCIFKYSSPINYVPSFLDKRSRIPWLEITFCVFWSFVQGKAFSQSQNTNL